MRIVVKAFATLRDDFGGRGRITLNIPDDSDVETLILKLKEALGEGSLRKILIHGGPNPNLKILVNGREIRYLKGLKTKLEDGDVVAFIPPVAGG